MTGVIIQGNEARCGRPPCTSNSAYAAKGKSNCGESTDSLASTEVSGSRRTLVFVKSASTISVTTETLCQSPFDMVVSIPQLGVRSIPVCEAKFSYFCVRVSSHL